MIIMLMRIITGPSSPFWVIRTAVEEAAFLARSRKPLELIDMDQHSGEHPRIGAADVVPFVPIQDITRQGLCRNGGAAGRAGCGVN